MGSGLSRTLKDSSKLEPRIRDGNGSDLDWVHLDPDPDPFSYPGSRSDPDPPGLRRLDSDPDPTDPGPKRVQNGSDSFHTISPTL